jgi:ABC-type molybdate transport system substrate-binding protein
MAAPLAVAAALLALSGATDAPGRLRVRASYVVAPCVEAAVAAWPGPHTAVQVETAGPLAAGAADVLVASSVELTRALEGGTADEATDLDVARVPWVMQVRSAGAKVRGPADLATAGVEITVPDSPAAYEARRWAAATGGGRVREASGRELREAPVAVVPLSLAGTGERIAVDVPPLVARAALTLRPERPAEARAFLAFLSSEPGQKAFAACPTP